MKCNPLLLTEGLNQCIGFEGESPYCGYAFGGRHSGRRDTKYIQKKFPVVKETVGDLPRSRKPPPRKRLSDPPEPKKKKPVLETAPVRIEAPPKKKEKPEKILTEKVVAQLLRKMENDEPVEQVWFPPPQRFVYIPDPQWIVNPRKEKNVDKPDAFTSIRDRYREKYGGEKRFRREFLVEALECGELSRYEMDKLINRVWPERG